MAQADARHTRIDGAGFRVLPGGLDLTLAPERVAAQRETNADAGYGSITPYRHSHHRRDEYT